MKKNTKIVVTCIIVAVVLIVAGILTWILWPKKTNKEVYTDAIKESFNISSLVKTSEGKDVKDVLADHIVKLTLEGNLADEGNGKVEVYAGKNQLYALLTGGAGSEKVNIEGLLKDEKLYFTIKDVLSKYYYVDQNDANFNISALDVDSDKITNYLVDSFFEVIDNDNVTKDSEELTINGKTYKTDKYSHPFTGADVQKVVESFVKKLKGDKEFRKQIEELIESLGTNEKIDLDEVFDTVIKESAALKDLGQLFTYTVYLYKGDVISTSISISIPSGDQKVPLSLVVNNVEDGGKRFVQAYLSTMGQRMFEATLDQTSETNTDLSVKVMGEKYIEGKITNDKDSVKVKITGTDKLPVDFDLEMNFKVVDDLNMTGNIKISIEGEEIAFDVKTEEVKALPEIDLSNSAPISEMTDEEKAALESIFGSVSKVANPIDAYKEYSSRDNLDYDWDEDDYSFNDNYDYNYNWDEDIDFE